VFAFRRRHRAAGRFRFSPKNPSIGVRTNRTNRYGSIRIGPHRDKGQEIRSPRSAIRRSNTATTQQCLTSDADIRHVPTVLSLISDGPETPSLAHVNDRRWDTKRTPASVVRPRQPNRTLTENIRHPRRRSSRSIYYSHARRYVTDVSSSFTPTHLPIVNNEQEHERRSVVFFVYVRRIFTTNRNCRSADATTTDGTDEFRQKRSLGSGLVPDDDLLVAVNEPGGLQLHATNRHGIFHLFHARTA